MTIFVDMIPRVYINVLIHFTCAKLTSASCEDSRKLRPSRKSYAIVT